MFPSRPTNVKFGKSASSATPPTGLYDAVITKVVDENSTKVFLDGVVDSPSNSLTLGVDALVGSVTEVARKQRVYARIPRLVGGFEFGPLDFIGQTPSVGDRAFVGFREGRPDNLVLLTRGGTSNLSELLDVSVVDPLSGEVVVYDGNQWNNASIGLDSLGDVTIATPNDNEVLIYNLGSGQWENASVPAGLIDHGGLTGLGEDDHGQYLLRSELGTGGGVDADLLDGEHGAFYAPLTALDNYLLLTGGTLTDTLTLDRGGVSLVFKPGLSADHAFMEFYARSATPTTRSGWMGYGAAGTTELTLMNELNGDIIFRTAAGIQFFYDASDTSVRFLGVTKVRFPDGTAGIPGLSFDADPDTGLYRIAANHLGFSTGSTLRLEIVGNQVRFVDGTEALPAIAFIGDTDTGLRRVSTNTAALVAAGADVFRWVSTASTFYSGTDASWSGFTATERVALHGEAGIIHACRSAGEALFLGRNTSDGSIVRFDRSGTQVGSISVTTTATAYNTSSDERLKENIVDANTRNTLDKVNALRVREFDWIEDNRHETGLVAQEVAEVYPDAVTPPERQLETVRVAGEEELTGSPYWMIDYSKMVPLLLGAIQEQQKEIDSLETRIGTLEALVAQLVA